MTCKECFHWKACKSMLEEQGYSVGEDFAGDASRCDTFVNAAAVVPKSEVAMIFEELYKSVISKIPLHICPIFKDDMDFEDGFRNGKTDALLEVLMIIAELKKKYTEDQK